MFHSFEFSQSVDRDSGINAETVYSIKSNSDELPLYISSDKGTIYTTRYLEEDIPRFEFQVEAANTEPTAIRSEADGSTDVTAYVSATCKTISVVDYYNNYSKNSFINK